MGPLLSEKCLCAIDHAFSGFTGWCDNPRGMLGEHEKTLRRVIYKLLECSPNIPSGLSRR